MNLIGSLVPVLYSLPCWATTEHIYQACAAVAVVFTVRVDLHTLLVQCLQQRVQIFHPIIDHESGVAGSEIFGAVRKNRPYSHPLAFAVVNLTPFEDRTCSVRRT